LDLKQHLHIAVVGLLDTISITDISLVWRDAREDDNEHLLSEAFIGAYPIEETFTTSMSRLVGL
jgi:hypothetical protein